MKKSKKILSIFLSILICFGFLLPTTAYASTRYTFNIFSWRVSTADSSYALFAIDDASLGIRLSSDSRYFYSTKYYQSDFKDASLIFQYDGGLASDTELTLYLDLSVSRYVSFDIEYRISYINSSNKFVRIATGFQNVVGVESDDSLSRVFVISGITNDIEIPSGTTCEVDIIFSNAGYRPGYDGSNSRLSFGINEFYIISDLKSTGLLNSIIDWIKGIWEKLVNLPSEIGSFITSLGDSIKGFFSDLTGNLKEWFSSIGDWFSNIINNLREWFSNIGDWFSELGASIGNFFENLWGNFSDFFTYIVDGIISWWQSVIDFLQSLVTVPDGYFDEYQERVSEWFDTHFGVVWQAPQFIITLITDLYNSIKNSSSFNSAVIVIPEIRIPYYDLAILPRTSYDLMNLINSNELIKWIYNTYAIVAKALIYIAVINYCFNKYQEIIKNRVEASE